METVTLEALRAAAERLGTAHQCTTATAALCQGEIQTAIAPIVAAYKEQLDRAAEEEATAREQLDALLAQSPHLFIKPRSASVNGVSYGYKKDPDGLDWDEEPDVIAAIKSLLKDKAPLLIRTKEELNVDALEGLTAAERQKVGVRTVTGVDKRYIRIGDADVEKLAKALIADAVRRQGEEEPAPAKKTKRAKKEKVAA